MAITIKGVKLTSLSIEKDSDGKEKVSGNYSLMSNVDKVLAKQGFNGYNDVKIAFSHDTITALNSLMAGVKTDVETTLGLEEQKG